ncbi:MAG: hypothetical protein NTV01_21840 [Bacteroidia bacterium]|nr:hypothetical protein [Bacteroidia bacterium]
MKKRILIAFLMVALIFIMASPGRAELNNITAKGVDGDLCFYNATGNEVFCIESTNRRVSYPTGSGIDIESGATFKLAGTTVTATAANLNAIPTATGTGAMIDAMTKNVYSSATTLTVTDSSSTTSIVTITLKDASGDAVSGIQLIRVYLADDASGNTPCTVDASGTVTFTTGNILKTITSKRDWDVVTNTSGVAVLSVSNAGAVGSYGRYVVLVLPNRKIKVSAIVNPAGS